MTFWLLTEMCVRPRHLKMGRRDPAAQSCSIDGQARLITLYVKRNVTATERQISAGNHRAPGMGGVFGIGPVHSRTVSPPPLPSVT